MISAARVAAYDILRAVSCGAADLPAAIADARTRLRDERDSRLAAEIAAGVQRWRGLLDHLIAEVSRRRLERLDAEVVEILRLSIYQLLHLTRVPTAAVVDDAVDLTRRAGKRSASGFVNAVLRRVSRMRHRLPLPARPDNAVDRERALAYLSVTLSHPRWVAARWLDRFGLEAAEAWIQFNNHPAPLTLRANSLQVTRSELAARLEDDGVRVRPGAFAPGALIVEAGFPLRGQGAELGWFVAQDEASQLVALMATPQPGARVLDTCASPGGKTTAFAADVGGRGIIVACDVRPRRIALLRQSVARCRAANVRVVQADFLAPPPFASVFDLAVVDAPCSGLGTLRRDPDIRWRRKESDLPALAADALVMLRHGSSVVKSGGRLIYATCSSEPEENEGVVDRFLGGAPEFVEIDARRASPRLPEGVVDARGHLRTEPHRHGLEAFFGAVFERRAL